LVLFLGKQKKNIASAAERREVLNPGETRQLKMEEYFAALHNPLLRTYGALKNQFILCSNRHVAPMGQRENKVQFHKNDDSAAFFGSFGVYHDNSQERSKRKKKRSAAGT